MLDFALQKGVTLTGTTVDAVGKPMPKVFLLINVKSALVGPDQDAAGGMGVTADDQGRWEIAGWTTINAMPFTLGEPTLGEPTQLRW